MFITDDAIMLLSSMQPGDGLKLKRKGKIEGIKMHRPRQPSDNMLQ